MPIISVSMDNETLVELSHVEKSLGFSGRSEAVRAGVRSLIAENRELENLSGRVKAVLLLVHAEKAEGAAAGLSHRFEGIISTQIHSNLKEGKCLEIFMLDGEASRVAGLVKAARTNRKIENAKLVLP